ncbi:hypothetical protein HUJ05_012843 [Dendroctonus ponderosae]|nr:hypothetical protein HUJ05_012843 [Dendroctonus ponderosae]
MAIVRPESLALQYNVVKPDFIEKADISLRFECTKSFELWLAPIEFTKFYQKKPFSFSKYLLQCNKACTIENNTFNFSRKINTMFEVFPKITWKSAKITSLFSDMVKLIVLIFCIVIGACMSAVLLNRHLRQIHKQSIQ